jgi:hypothetical protein
VAININGYLSNGSNRKRRVPSSRFGFSYDLSEISASSSAAGRAYDRTLYDYLQLEQTKFALATAEVRFNTADHPCTVNG